MVPLAPLSLSRGDAPARHRDTCNGDGVNAAYFISPHGFGHAARSAAIMRALSNAVPRIQFEIFTTVPPWFFEDSAVGLFRYHRLATDVGLVQKSPLEEDVKKTVALLDDFLPFPEALVLRLSNLLRALQCRVVMCDVSPLGLAVAERAGIESVLIENFTWDWIYQSYTAADVRLADHELYMARIYSLATVHIQTTPVCHVSSADLTSEPVSRAPRLTRPEVRRRLGIPAGAKMVMITMGGIPEDLTFVDRLATTEAACFVVPGTTRSVARKGNVVLLPHHSEFYHPDLVHASDVVIGKLGYSTLAETYHAGVPFGFVARPTFPEMAPLGRFATRHMQGTEIPVSQFRSGAWIDRLPELLARGRSHSSRLNGAAQVAEYISGMI